VSVFARQRRVRSQSLWLLLAFAVSLVLFMALAHLLAGVVSLLAHDAGDNWLFSDHALLITLCLYAMVALGCVFRYLGVRAGGAVLARHYGAVAVPERGLSRQVKQFVTVTAEMAIASRQSPPSLWVLPRERGVNAFILGDEERAALVVTQGALDALDRDALQALVAHEFAHLRNGDATLNMRTLVFLSGLLAIDQIGRILTGRDWRQQFLPFAIVGLVLRALGSVGVLSAGAIRAAFGRQRELLADAGAVQFTRQTSGLIDALTAGQSDQQGARLWGWYADELAHVCFLSPLLDGRANQWGAVHPPIDARIHAIDPHHAHRTARAAAEPPASTRVSTQLGMEVVSADNQGVSFGSHTGQGILMLALPDTLAICLMGSQASEAALFALLMHYFDAEPQRIHAALVADGDAAVADLALQQLQQRGDALDQHSLGVIAAATGELSERLDADALQALMQRLETCAMLDGGQNLHEYMILTLIAQALGVEAQRPAPPEELGLAEAASVVLSLLADAAGHDPDRTADRYRRHAKVYQADAFPQRCASEPGIVDDLQAALFVLGNQMPAARQAFIRHCAEIALDDSHATHKELRLLQFLSVTLHTPLPPL